MFLPSNITLKFGDSGDFVAELQRRLAMVKCFSEDQVNGFYDGSTVNGVMQFQGSNGLHADGVAGPETLRRLNGVIAGDTGGDSTSSQEEEEKKRLEAESQALAFGLAQQQPDPGMWGQPAEQLREEAPAQAAPPPIDVSAPVMSSFAPAPPPIDLSAPPPQMSSFAPAPQDLTAMLMGGNAQQPIDLAQQNATREPEQLSARQQAQQQQQSFAARPDPIPEQYVPPQPPQGRVFTPEPEPEAQQPATLMQRAGRFANAMIEKLANYFEAKLPPNVLREVQQIGVSMAQAGLREAPIPTGPENVRAPEQVPGRDQQPQQIR